MARKPRWSPGVRDKTQAAANRGDAPAIYGARLDSCPSGKRAWTRRKDVRVFIRAYLQHHPGHRLKAYRCTKCGHLHTTSQEADRWTC